MISQINDSEAGEGMSPIKSRKTFNLNSSKEI